MAILWMGNTTVAVRPLQKVVLAPAVSCTCECSLACRGGSSHLLEKTPPRSAVIVSAHALLSGPAFVALQCCWQHKELVKTVPHPEATSAFPSAARRVSLRVSICTRISSQGFGDMQSQGWETAGRRWPEGPGGKWAVTQRVAVSRGVNKMADFSIRQLKLGKCHPTGSYLQCFGVQMQQICFRFKLQRVLSGRQLQSGREEAGLGRMGQSGGSSAESHT